ncbi:hypothetical protein COO60DRAFT_1462631 [Scenedesmus sp. NREL 46B-D3]|nr:hypothetical protein COO60DRAFT_1462631 [Scenedesmus sp. NREL 46B-D3]
MELPVMESIPHAMKLLKTVLTYRTAPSHAGGPYFLHQVYSDFELKSGQRLDPKLLGYDSLADLVLQGTQLTISLTEEPQGSNRLRVVREKPQQNLNPFAGYAGG